LGYAKGGKGGRFVLILVHWVEADFYRIEAISRDVRVMAVGEFEFPLNSFPPSNMCRWWE
jgi:hypothetical protein